MLESVEKKNGKVVNGVTHVLMKCQQCGRYELSKWDDGRHICGNCVSVELNRRR